MDKSSPSPPAAPDPVATANAQATANADTARLTAQLNRVNQVGPTGSITYSNNSTPAPSVDAEVARHRGIFDQGGGRDQWWVKKGSGYSDGKEVDFFGNPIAASSGTGDTFDEQGLRDYYAKNPLQGTPGDQWTQTTTLSPEQQRLYDLTTAAQTTYGEIGNNQLNAVKGTLSQPDTTDYAAARSQALAAQRARLDPYYTQQEEGLRSHLLNAGLTEGSEGWNKAFRQFNEGRNDALLAADLRAGDTVGQQIGQTTALRARPLNEASVLLSGGQVQIPQLQQTAGVNVAPTDVIGATNTAYQGQLANWQTQQQQGAAGLGGLFGLAGTLGGAAIRKWG